MAADIARRGFVTGLGGTMLGWPLAAHAQRLSPASASDLDVRPGDVPARRGGLKGNVNYFIGGDCTPVLDLSVTIDVTQDIVADFGFSFQLNAYSPQGANSVYQQYTIGFDTTGGPTPQLGLSIDNWPVKGFDDLTGDVINYGAPLLKLPGPRPALPAGYRLTISCTQRSGRETSPA